MWFPPWNNSRGRITFKERSHDEIKHDSKKKGRRRFEQAVRTEEIVDWVYEIIRVGKQGLDGFVLELGSMMAEAIMDMEPEERSGPEYYPFQEGLYNWAYQNGSHLCGRSEDLC